ncbi:MAG: hypothetical protein HY908_08450 [Myxococcales bacterium]|nr:hypothetical protein [Myxococcales bacterium]
MGTEAGGKEVQATGATVKLNQMSGGPGPAQGQGPLLAGAGADATGGQSGGDAEDDEAKKRAAAALAAKKPGKSSGPDPAECTAPGHPVDAVSGQVVDDAIALRLPGAFPFVFRRWYSSARAGEKGALGRGGWVHAYEQWVVREQEVTTYRRGDGRDVYFDRIAPGGSTFHRRERLTLSADRAGYTVEDHVSGLRHFFEPRGRSDRAALVAIADRSGHRIVFEYDGDRLIRIVDTAGRELRLLPTPQGFLRRLEVWAVAPRALDAPPDERPPRLCQWVDFVYHGTEELAAVSDALGQTRRFDYDARHRMVRTALENGVAFHYRFDDELGRRARARVRTWQHGRRERVRRGRPPRPAACDGHRGIGRGAAARRAPHAVRHAGARPGRERHALGHDTLRARPARSPAARPRSRHRRPRRPARAVRVRPGGLARCGGAWSRCHPGA